MRNKTLEALQLWTEEQLGSKKVTAHSNVRLVLRSIGKAGRGKAKDVTRLAQGDFFDLVLVGRRTRNPSS